MRFATMLWCVVHYRSKMPYIFDYSLHPDYRLSTRSLPKKLFCMAERRTKTDPLSPATCILTDFPRRLHGAPTFGPPANESHNTPTVVRTSHRRRTKGFELGRRCVPVRGVTFPVRPGQGEQRENARHRCWKADNHERGLQIGRFVPSCPDG
jgi:hypothetical protein